VRFYWLIKYDETLWGKYKHTGMACFRRLIKIKKWSVRPKWILFLNGDRFAWNPWMFMNGTAVRWKWNQSDCYEKVFSRAQSEVDSSSEDEKRKYYIILYYIILYYIILYYIICLMYMQCGGILLENEAITCFSWLWQRFIPFIVVY